MCSYYGCSNEARWVILNTEPDNHRYYKWQDAKFTQEGALLYQLQAGALPGRLRLYVRGEPSFSESWKPGLLAACLRCLNKATYEKVRPSDLHDGFWRFVPVSWVAW